MFGIDQHKKFSVQNNVTENIISSVWKEKSQFGIQHYQWWI